jgi:hypothetical protein
MRWKTPNNTTTPALYFSGVQIRLVEEFERVIAAIYF